MSLKLITPPVALAVSLDEIKAQLRIDDATQDSYLTTLIGAATQVAEHETGRAFITQTWEAAYNCFPQSALELGRPPVIDIEFLRYIDLAGAVQQFPLSSLVIDSDLMPQFVSPAMGLAWPSDVASVTNAVRVRFRTGYGLTSADVPANARVWITLAAMQLYQGCGAEGMDALRSNPLLDDLRVYR